MEDSKFSSYNFHYYESRPFDPTVNETRHKKTCLRVCDEGRLKPANAQADLRLCVRICHKQVFS